jgi:hypothetical protein
MRSRFLVVLSIILLVAFTVLLNARNPRASRSSKEPQIQIGTNNLPEAIGIDKLPNRQINGSSHSWNRGSLQPRVTVEAADIRSVFGCAQAFAADA